MAMMQRALAGALVCTFGLAQAPMVQAQGTDQTTFYNENGLKLRWHLQGGFYLATEGNVFWDLANATGQGDGFETDKTWQEVFIKPGISFDYTLNNGATLYGKLSAVSSYTRGTDPFDEGDNGETTLEEAYLALRGTTETLSYDISLGAREFRLGTGMLISNGATSGFERGALKFGPRKAWERSATVKLSANGILSRSERVAFDRWQKRTGRF